MPNVTVSGGFDDLRSRHVRFLEEASKLGDLHVLLWSDEVIRSFTGKPPKFPLEERRYFLEAIRYVRRVTTRPPVEKEGDAPRPDILAVEERDDTPAKRALCEARELECRVVPEAALSVFPEPAPAEAVPSSRKKVLVTGCFDWLHTGHVRFFEEVSELGDLYVALGHDRNIRQLKGEGHPMFPERERAYMVESVRHVTRALVSTGDGWLDAEPEILRLKPDIYAVNEDGDKPVKREFCAKQGIEYVVLKRVPKEGLPRRESSNLRGF